MPRKRDEFWDYIAMSHIRHAHVRWSNFLISSAMSCSLIERRALYLITAKVKEVFKDNELDVPEHWKDLIVTMSEDDLKAIGGKKNVPRTYTALKELGKRFIPMTRENAKGETEHGRVHWIDSFFYNPNTKTYDIRVSPEILPFMLNVTENFSTLDIGTAMFLKSKESQKMYELCCQYSGNYRHIDNESRKLGYVYKKGVVVIPIDKFRKMFNLQESRDERTGRVETKAKYVNYNDMVKNVLEPACQELHRLYQNGASDVWFDYQAGPRKGRGGKVSSILIYVYTKQNPKIENDRPWEKGDEPLYPYCEATKEKDPITPAQKIHANPLNELPEDSKQVVLAELLKKYFSAEEVAYYMKMPILEGRKNRSNPADYIMQMIQVIQDKEQQPKFRNAKITYQRNCLARYVFTDNLKAQFNWFIPPMKEFVKKRKC